MGTYYQETLAIGCSLFCSIGCYITHVRYFSIHHFYTIYIVSLFSILIMFHTYAMLQQQKVDRTVATFEIVVTSADQN